MDRPFCSELKDGIFLAELPKKEKGFKNQKRGGF